MEQQFIYTISRQYGSGGREIGKRLASLLSISYYDNEIITLAAQKSGISPNYFKAAEALSVSNFLFSTANLAPSTSAVYDGSLNDKMFQAQSDSIRTLAKEGSCVFVGRCANYILRDFPNAIHIFIHAPLPSRIQRVVTEYGIDTAYAEDKVKKTDKTRSSYYNFYTNQKWGQFSNYHLIINSDFSGLDGAVALIRHFAEIKNKF